MEAFYASLEVNQDTQPNNDVSMSTRPSEETQKAMKILRDLMSKKFSLLLHPGRSTLLKDALNYFLSLPAPEEDGFSITTKWVIQQLSQSFAQWSLDYYNARFKLETTTVGLSQAEKIKGDLEANVEDFQEMDKEEKCFSDELDQLLEEKRVLEDKITAVKTKIAKCTAMRDLVAKRRVELFDEGRVVKEELNDLRNHAPRWKGEHESAKITQANIEADWLKLAERFNTCVGLEKYWP